MTDLISRQAALDIVFDFAETPHRMYQQIRELPTIDPVKHGKWKEVWEDFHFVCECTICGQPRSGVSEWNYCPSCGARMDKGDGNG